MYVVRDNLILKPQSIEESRCGDILNQNLHSENENRIVIKFSNFKYTAKISSLPRFTFTTT